MKIKNIKLSFGNLFLILVFLILCILPFVTPIKETISCKNSNCHVKDYSILYTNTKFYDLSNITLETRINRTYRYGRISLLPISKCNYSSIGKAENDMFMLEQKKDVVLKHASISDIAFLTLILFLFYVFFEKKKFFKYGLFAVLARTIYILLI